MTDIRINRGSDADFKVSWPADLTGRTLSLYEPHPLLAANMTLTLEAATPEASIIAVRLEWSDSMPMGRAMRFRIRAALGDDARTTQEMWVVVQ